MIKEKDINESFIQKKLNNVKSTHKYIMENLYVFDWESDFLLKTNSGYYYEYEIKISVSDFKHDFVKEEKHFILKNGFKKRYTYRNIKGVRTVIKEEDVPKKRPNYFTYVVPWTIINQVKELVPEYAGLICLEENGSLTEIKKSPKLHSEKYSDESLKLCEKFYYNWRNAKDFKDSTMRSKNNTIKELRNRLALVESEFEAVNGFKFEESL